MATITFRQLVADVDDYVNFERSPQHIVSRITFTVSFAGSAHDMSVEVRQSWGANFATEPLDVGAPTGAYDGPWDQNEFCGLVGQYYRRWLRALDAGTSDAEGAYATAWKADLHVHAAAGGYVLRRPPRVLGVLGRHADGHVRRLVGLRRKLLLHLPCGWLIERLAQR